MRYLCNRYDYFPSDMLFRIFDTKIKPILLYGSELWGVKRYEDIENAHIKFCKMVLNLGRTTWNCAAIGECGRHPMFVDYHCRSIKYWCKLLTTDRHRYISKCYTQLYHHDAGGRQNWVTEIRTLICSLGFGTIWYSQTVGDAKIFMLVVKQRLIDIGRQEWHSRADILCPEYLEFHPSPFAAPYITIISSYKKRRLFSLLRTYSLPLKNNMLRWNMSNNNLCDACVDKYVENEFHILFRCPCYTALREELVPTKYSVNPSVYKMYMLFATRDEDVINAITQFVSKALRGRLKQKSIYSC